MSDMELPYYNTVKRAELASMGYVRIHSENKHIPSVIKELCFDYFGYFFVSPNNDPSNFITSQDIEKSLQLKQRGNELMKQNNYDQAEQVYTSAISYNPNDGKLRSNRSLCYLKLNELNKAFIDAKISIFNEPLWYKSWLRLAQIYEAMEKYSESLNMIEHSEDICYSQNDEKNMKILEKYAYSVMNKKEKYDKLYPDKININHMNDEDRLEWKYDDDHGVQDESIMNDEQILDLPPFFIWQYSELIIPEKVQISRRSSSDETNANDGDEWNRWFARKWIQKLFLFQRLNTNKLLLDFDEYIHDEAPQVFEHWSISWSAQPYLYLNKRLFSINIFSSNGKCVFFGDTYCRPNAKDIIKCIKLSILFPLDTGFELVKQQKNTEIDPKDWKYSRRPFCVCLQYRLKDEFKEIESEMNKVGICCELLSYSEMVNSCNQHNTNIDGWNYLNSYPRYLYQLDDV